MLTLTIQNFLEIAGMTHADHFRKSPHQKCLPGFVEFRDIPDEAKQACYYFVLLVFELFIKILELRGLKKIQPRLIGFVVDYSAQVFH